MSYSSIQRTQLVYPMTLFAGDLSAARSENTKENLAVFVLPTNCEIKRLWCSYTTESGTGPAMTITLERGTTVLTSATASADNVPVSSGEVSIVADGPSGLDILNVKQSAANTDNAFEGLLVWIEVQPIRDLE